MTWLREIKGFFLSLMAEYFFDRRDWEKARKWMDRSNATGSKGDAYRMATDGILYVLEGRGSGGALRFTDCLALIDKPRFPNHEYLKIFCEFWLKALDLRTLPNDLEALANEAAGLPTDRWVKSRFRFPSSESIRKNVRGVKADGAVVTFDF